MRRRASPRLATAGCASGPSRRPAPSCRFDRELQSGSVDTTVQTDEISCWAISRSPFYVNRLPLQRTGPVHDGLPDMVCSWSAALPQGEPPMNSVDERRPLQRLTSPIERHVGDRLRLARRALSLSQEALAEQLGVTFQQVQKYEKGINRISAGRLHQVAEILDVPVSYFFPDSADGSAAVAAGIGPGMLGDPRGNGSRPDLFADCRYEGEAPGAPARPLAR
jgi:transcriptional regulator with XRE-family HTH domain